jgi:hypothetical protein
VYLLTPEPADRPARADDRIMTVLGETWCELLSLDSVSGQDDFFDLGGHSLLVPRVQERVERQLGVALPAVAVFEYPTLRELAEAIAARSAPAAGEHERPQPPTADPRAALRRRSAHRTTPSGAG